MHASFPVCCVLPAAGAHTVCSYVFCRQRQDETLRRGGEQVSVVVLATSPFSGALLPLSQAAGHAFFNEGPLALAMVRERVLLSRWFPSFPAAEELWPACLEALACLPHAMLRHAALCHAMLQRAMSCTGVLCLMLLQMYNQVLAWPPPVPGSTMYVPLGATIANVRVPHFCLLPPPQPAVDPAVQVGCVVQQHGLGVQQAHKGSTVTASCSHTPLSQWSPLPASVHVLLCSSSTKYTAP